MKKRVKWTKKALKNLEERFRLGEHEGEVLGKIEEKVNIGEFESWICPRGGERRVVVVSGMRFVLVKEKSGLHLVINALTPGALDTVVRGWAKKGEAGASNLRGRPLRSMPFAALAGIQIAGD